MMGENGFGKSTVLKILAKLLLPDNGKLILWQGAKFAFISQDQQLFA
jgi:ATPase subunit of ABC transporter with duplicated ATPase domains